MPLGSVGLDRGSRIIGVARDDVFIAPECGNVGCPITAVSLANGRRAEVAMVCQVAAVAAPDGTLASDGALDGDCTSETYPVVRYDPGGTRSTLLREFTDRNLLMVEMGRTVGIDTPPGWVVLGPGGGLLAVTRGIDGLVPLLIRVSDGFALEFAALRGSVSNIAGSCRPRDQPGPGNVLSKSKVNG